MVSQAICTFCKSLKYHTTDGGVNNRAVVVDHAVVLVPLRAHRFFLVDQYA